jgi:hypothetical protein
MPQFLWWYSPTYSSLWCSKIESRPFPKPKELFCPSSSWTSNVLWNRYACRNCILDALTLLASALSTCVALPCCRDGFSIMLCSLHFTSFLKVRPWRPIGLWVVDASTHSRQFTRRWRWGQLYAPVVLYPQEDSWYSFLLEGHAAA